MVTLQKENHLLRKEKLFLLELGEKPEFSNDEVTSNLY